MASGASVPHTLPVQIGSRQYLVDAAKVQRRTLPSTREAVTQNPAGLDAVNIEGAWTKVIPSFHHGAGQTVYDGEFSNPYRVGYLTGTWIGTPGVVTLTPGVTHTDSEATIDGGACNMIVVNDSVYARLGTALNKWADTNLGSQAAITGMTDPIWLTAFNGVPYVTNGSTIYSISGTTASSFSTQDADVIEVCNGRFIAGHDSSVYEISSGGAASLIWTHPEDGDWKMFVGAPGAMYGLFTGTYAGSTIYVWPDVDADGTFGAPYIAAPAPRGELFTHCVVVAGDILALASNRGVRLAVIKADGTLTFGPLITGGMYLETGAQVGTFVTITGMTVLGSSLYISVSDSGAGGIYRFHLDQFADQDLVPAWEAAYNSGPVNEVIAHPNGGAYYAVATGVSLRRFEHVDRPDFTGAQNFTSSGQINTGLLTFGVSEPKQILQVSVDHDPLPANTSVALTVYSRSGSSLGTTTNTTDGETVTTVTLAATTAAQRAFTVSVTLASTLSTATPTIRGGIRVRVAPVLPRQEEVIFPINLRGTVKGRDGSPVNQSSLTEHDYLNGLIEAGAPVAIQEGSKTYYALVDQLVYPGDPESGGKWSDDDGWYDTDVLVRLITLDLS